MGICCYSPHCYCMYLMVMGFILLVLGIVIAVVDNYLISLVYYDSYLNYSYLGIATLVVGITMIIVGLVYFLGVGEGDLTGMWVMLILIFATLVCITSAAWWLVYHTPDDVYVMLMEWMQLKPPPDNINKLQSEYECCGANGAEDYITIFGQIPGSCCKNSSAILCYRSEDEAANHTTTVSNITVKGDWPHGWRRMVTLAMDEDAWEMEFMGEFADYVAYQDGCYPLIVRRFYTCVCLIGVFTLIAAITVALGFYLVVRIMMRKKPYPP